MNLKERFRKTLTAPAKDRPLLDAIASSGEVIADVLLKDDLISAIPIFSTALKVVKAKDSFSDRVFATKLQEFIAGVGELPSAARQKIASDLTSTDEGRRAGETVLLVLDRMTDLDKPALLGFLFKQFTLDRLTAVELRRLAVAVDVAFSDDLLSFLDEPPGALKPVHQWVHRERLVASGLMRLLMGETIDTSTLIYFEPTALGQLLFTLVNDPRFSNDA